jgi:hypothetical protein
LLRCRLKHNVAALDIRANVSESQRFQFTSELSYRQNIISTNIDASKQCDPGVHRYSDFSPWATLMSVAQLLPETYLPLVCFYCFGVVIGGMG